MAKYFLTGAAGFIASHVAHQLLDAGHEVIAIDNLNQAYDPQLKDYRLRLLKDRNNFSFYQTDLCDRSALEKVWGAGDYDGVINLAARAGVRQSVENPWVYVESNMIGALNLLELCRMSGVKKFVLASTSSLYGANNSRPFSENADTSHPLSPYAASKGGAEMMCHSYHYLHNIDITILRYFTVYGPAGRPDMSIFRFIQWISEGRPVIVYGDGDQERDFTFVDDIARGTIAALRPVGFKVINLGGDKPYPLIDVIHRIEAIIEQKAQIEWRDTAPADVRATWADITAARKVLGWEPGISLDEGLSASVAWYMQERSWAKDVETQD
jgi:UDP-glucuronate 4-epimerase